MVKSLSAYTGLSRVIDPSIPSNRYALVVAFLAGVIGFWAPLIGGDGSVEAFALAVQMGVGTFLAWAIARELDPDDNRAAAIAAPLAILAAASGPPTILALFGVIMATRLTAGTTGVPPTLLDVVVGGVTAGVLAVRPVGIGIGAAIAGAFAFVALHGQSYRSRAAVGAVAAAAGTIIGMVIGGAYTWTSPEPAEWAVGIVGIAAALAMPHKLPHSKTDYSGEPLDPTRIFAARVVGLGAGLAAFGFAGGPAFSGLGGLWMAFAGAAVAGRWLPVPARTRATEPGPQAE